MIKMLMVLCLSALPLFTLAADNVKMEGEFIWAKGKKDMLLSEYLQRK